VSLHDRRELYCGSGASLSQRRPLDGVMARCADDPLTSSAAMTSTHIVYISLVILAACITCCALSLRTPQAGNALLTALDRLRRHPNVIILCTSNLTNIIGTQ
jgi:hypothetical protein